MMGSVKEESKVERVVEGEADEAGTSECIRRMRGRVLFRTWPMGLCGKVSQLSIQLSKWSSLHTCRPRLCSSLGRTKRNARRKVSCESAV